MKKTLLGLSLSAVLLAACNDEDSKVTEPPQPEEEVEVVETELVKQEEENKEVAQQIEIIQKFINIAYFDQGTYKDFVALFADAKKVNTEEEFNTFRETNDPTKEFSVDGDNLEGISKHLVAVVNDENNADVYWVEDKETAKREDAKFVWKLVKVNDEWKIQN